MSNATSNGRLPRKQLGDQLDRLDSILDGLSEALNEAVADAAREGSKAAVKEILGEILTNPELRAMFAGMAPQAPSMTAVPASVPTPKPLSSKVCFRTRLKNKLTAVKKAVVFKCKAAMTTVTNTARTLAMVMPLKKILLVGVLAGMSVGMVSYVCPHALSAVASGVGGACVAVTVQAGSWLRRSAGMFGLSVES